MRTLRGFRPAINAVVGSLQTRLSSGGPKVEAIACSSDNGMGRTDAQQERTMRDGGCVTYDQVYKPRTVREMGWWDDASGVLALICSIVYACPMVTRITPSRERAGSTSRVELSTREEEQPKSKRETIAKA